MFAFGVMHSTWLIDMIDLAWRFGIGMIHVKRERGKERRDIHVGLGMPKSNLCSRR